MRVRILHKPPEDYEGELGPLMEGRIYNLPPAAASALMVDGYAELYEILSSSEKRDRSEQAAQVLWTSDDRGQQWPVVPPSD